MPSITTIIACALLAVCWLVLLGGTAASHDKDVCLAKQVCDTDWRISRSEAMRAAWWACWMEFFLLVLNAVALVMGADDWALVLCSVSAMATAVLIERAEEWLVTIEGLRGDKEESATAAAAGTIMCCIANLILIILVGNSRFRGSAVAKSSAAEAVVTAPA